MGVPSQCTIARIIGRLACAIEVLSGGIGLKTTQQAVSTIAYGS